MRYVWRDGDFRHPATGESMPVPQRDGLCVPMVISDIEPYRSPIDGRVIGSRSTQRYDLQSNDCVLKPPRAKPMGYKNPSFALKRGLPLNEPEK